MRAWFRAHTHVLPVVLISLSVSLLNILHVIIAALRTPQGHIYVGNAHYWEDYLLYLNHFYQGTHGVWLAVNRYTPEPTPASIIYITNVLMGKLSGFWGLSPVSGYTAWLFLLGIVQSLSIYLLITRIRRNGKDGCMGALIATVSTSCMNHIWVDSTSVWWPFQIWRTPHFAFDRLGGAPHQMVQTITLLLLATVLLTGPRLRMSSKLSVLLLGTVVVLAAILTITNPVQAVFFIAILWVTVIIAAVGKRFSLLLTLPPAGYVVAATATVGIVFPVVNAALNQLPHIQSKIWESAQMTATAWWFLLLSIGPVLFLAVPGVAIAIKKLSFATLFGMLAITLSYGIFCSPLPRIMGVSDLRFLFPATHAFLGLFSIIALDAWAKILKNRALPVSASAGILGLFFLINLPTLIWEMRQRLTPPDSATIQTVYVPRGTYDTMKFLESTPMDEVVLADPSLRLDSLVPPLSGHTTYSGHMLATIQNKNKQAEATAFFRGQKDTASAEKWMHDMGIRYVVWTSDASRYPFLTEVFRAGSFRIYRVM